MGILVGMPIARDQREQVARAAMDEAARKLRRLQEVEPYFIDLSLRENPFGASIGQTLEEKLAILPKLRAFGFQNILLGTLDYSMPDEPEVDDDFMKAVRDQGLPRDGGFAFTDIGRIVGDAFQPSQSQQKMLAYDVPNTLHEIYLSREGMASEGYDWQTLVNTIPASVEWILQNVKGDGGGTPRVIINVVDGCDAFMEDWEKACEAIAFLAQLPIAGVSLEDDRGTYMPFQVGAFVEMARTYLPPPKVLLVHVHSGAGFENASVLEALLRGADGVWGGLPKRAAIIGHASLGELMANLVRAGNTSLADTYAIDRLLPFATELQELDDPAAVPDDLPILGHNAYRLTLDFFRQLPTRAMDLPPERIGGSYKFRVAPLAADRTILGGRLLELGVPGPQDPAILDQMVRLMRRDLRAGKQIVYDEPDNLKDLYRRAGGPSW